MNGLTKRLRIDSNLLQLLLLTVLIFAGMAALNPERFLRA